MKKQKKELQKQTACSRRSLLKSASAGFAGLSLASIFGMPVEEQVAYATYRQILAALKFLYTVTLDRPWEIERIPFPSSSGDRL